MTFHIDTLSPITLIQDTHINMPFQSWELVPLEVNQVLLTVTTVFTKIQIHIKVCYTDSFHQRWKPLWDSTERIDSPSLVLYILKCPVNISKLYLEVSVYAKCYLAIALRKGSSILFTEVVRTRPMSDTMSLCLGNDCPCLWSTFQEGPGL